MRAVLFCGPTLAVEDLAPFANIEVRPPLRQGELYAATLARPEAIAILDGYFDGAPAVWHKEILWALTDRIAVFGASSMGALRAAELHTFGMRGVGRIFEDYRDGRLTDDDEVALLHGPAETGYLKLSEPMVNVRATLDRAVQQKILASAAAEQIAAVAKEQFYQQRTWATVLAAAAKVVPGDALASLTAWLPSGKVDQKHEDGLSLLRALDDFLNRGERQPPASFSFEWTETWAHAPWRNARPDIGNEGAAILDELRLDPETYRRVRREALLQALANDDVGRLGRSADRKEIASVTKAFRGRRNLLRRSGVERWALENGTDASRLERLMAERAELEALARMRDAELQAAMLDQLRLDGLYPRLRKRARAKARALTAGASPSAKMPPPALLSWYFRTRLKQEIPDDVAAHAADLGLSDPSDFYALIAAEHWVTVNRAKRRRSGPQME